MIKILKAVKLDSNSLENVNEKPSYIEDSYVVLNNIQKTIPTKNNHVLKAFLIQTEAYILKEDFLKMTE